MVGLVAGAGLALAALPAIAHGAAVTPTVATLTPPSPLPQGLGVFPVPGQALPPGSPIPANSVALVLTFPDATPAQATFTVTCPAGSAASAWGSGIASNGAGASPNIVQYTTMFGGVTSSSVLCSPTVSASVVKRLAKGTKLPKGLIAGDGVAIAMPPKMRRQTRLVRFTLSGLVPNVLSTVPTRICPVGYEMLESTTTPNVVFVPGIDPMVTSQGPSTATFTAVCLNSAYAG
jgi:hypothetical protein